MCLCAGVPCTAGYDGHVVGCVCVQVFHAQLGMMVTWLGVSEDKLASITAPSVSRDSIGRQLTDVLSLQNDVERKVCGRVHSTS